MLVPSVSQPKLQSANESNPKTKEAEGLQSIAKKSFAEIAKTFGEHPVITKAKKIDEGHYSNIYLVDEIAGQKIAEFPQVVIKTHNEVEHAKSELQSEIDFLNQLYQSELLTESEKGEIAQKPIKATFEGQEGFLMPYRSEGNLADYLLTHMITMQQKSDLARQLIYKMSLLSKAKAIYADIKQQNILVDLNGNKLTFDFTDFGSCYFAYRPENYPSGGLSITPLHVMARDYTALTAACEAALKDPNDPVKQKALEEASKPHLSRSLGLLLTETIDDQLTPFTDSYSFSQLKHYYKSNNPLQNLHKEDSKMATVLEGMLGVGEKQLTPEESWTLLNS